MRVICTGMPDYKTIALAVDYMTAAYLLYILHEERENAKTPGQCQANKCLIEALEITFEHCLNEVIEEFFEGPSKGVDDD